MPNTKTTLIKLFSLSMTFAAKLVQILLFPKNIQDGIPNKVSPYPMAGLGPENKI